MLRLDALVILGLTAVANSESAKRSVLNQPYMYMASLTSQTLPQLRCA